MYRNCALLVPNMMKSGMGENMVGFIYSWWFPYWTAYLWVNGFHYAHWVVIGVVIGGIVYKYQGKVLLLQNLLPINGENVDVSWLIGGRGVIYSGFSSIEFVAWVNIYPPLIASAMEMKTTSDQMWMLLNRCTRTSLVAEMKSSGSSHVIQIILKFLSVLKGFGQLVHFSIKLQSKH